MGNTFRIDNKDPLYKKLIKLPTAYYRLKNNGNGYTIYSHNNSAVEIKNARNVKLKWDRDKIFLYEEDSALKLNGQDFVIEQEAIIGKDKEAIVKKLQETDIGIILQNIPGENFGIELFISRSSPITGVLNFINLYDENDPVLQKIKKETGGLYFTIEGDYIYISDKNGACVSIYDKDNEDNCYQYQYTKDKCDVLTISDVSTIIGNLTETNNEKQKFTLQKGEELSDNIYEANVALNDKPIATLPKIGYYMLDDQLVMRNHVTKEEVIVPRDFHYLKVIKSNNDDYKLTFCNFLGNEFFEYKKYDPQYSNVSDEYKFISLSCMKEKRNLNLGELLSHRPSFFITEGIAEPDSLGNHQAVVFEVINSGKGEKKATLTDEFGYFDKNNKFHYCDYHKKMEYDTYDSSEINLKEMYKWTDKNSEFCFAEDNNIILHTIPELL
ncbi:hypothetical protein [Wolbachia endosymbiont (group A) of Rhinocyllus conicus]|uniref:hypothetical protein n=1 Tax=Wolbachia endosymbiont (group A) of Rhinocyllus conicus TaxID=2954053 RepID=UPI0022273AFB|nr:hypothetical protein [Wolbachia endosymbiont (group A) of Rhinocyllus conicus]